MVELFQKGWACQMDGDIEKALECYESAVKLGHGGARFHLNCIYRFGQDTIMDRKRTVEFKKLTIKDDEFDELVDCYMTQNNEKIQHNLAVLYFTVKKYEEALKWFLVAKNYAPSQTFIGFSYHKGLGVEKDFSKAYQWYLLAATQGYSLAENNLGSLYSNGFGVEKDRSKAHHWLLLAANRGLSTAQNNLGSMYKN